ncbi:hypothetical protein E2C01_041099 [Portunus trituberculatus]|uniref:Uncharacterized protein n=1 Tax=Portunus trituberculatus TaxID=210409 RepID=A0A5B7FPE8_PORTR|nr:hypothetical protein [Portunus trituberculatus]
MSYRRVTEAAQPAGPCGRTGRDWRKPEKVEKTQTTTLKNPKSFHVGLSDAVETRRRQRNV